MNTDYNNWPPWMTRDGFQLMLDEQMKTLKAKKEKSLLDKVRDGWYEAGFDTMFVKAPKDAQTFDHMLIVFSDENMKIIRRVSLYSSKEDKFVAEY